MAEDGHPAIRGKPPEKLAHQVIYTLAPELAERDHLEEALRLAKVGLVGSLRHGFDSCNAGLSEACFVCEGLAAVGSALGESWPRRSERDRG